MYKVSCLICLEKLLTLKKLQQHYKSKHSKLQLTRCLMKFRSFRKNTGLIRNKVRTRKRCNTGNVETLHIKQDLHISYGNKKIIIEKSDDNEDSIEVSIDGTSLNFKKNTPTAEVSSPLKPSKVCDDKVVISICDNPGRDTNRDFSDQVSSMPQFKYFRLDFQKSDEVKISDRNSPPCDYGQIESDLKDKKVENFEAELASDTESSSDAGKHSFYPIIDKKSYCSRCGNGYKTPHKLAEHMKLHNIQCVSCNMVFDSIVDYREHIKTHLLKLYVCHVCDFEFVQKELLLAHLNYHLQQEMLKNVLEMELEYPHYSANLEKMGRNAVIGNLVSYLSDTDYNINRNPYAKSFCKLCCREMYFYEYVHHMQLHFQN